LAFSYQFTSEICTLVLAFKSGNFSHCVAFRDVFLAFQNYFRFSFLFQVPKSDSDNEIQVSAFLQDSQSGLSTSLPAALREAKSAGI